MRHRFRSNFGQCDCLWCGYNKRYHSQECPITEELRYWLIDFAKANGRTWRKKLIDLWTKGEEASWQSQQIRNIIGPRKLMKIPNFILEDTRVS